MLQEIINDKLHISRTAGELCILVRHYEAIAVVAGHSHERTSLRRLRSLVGATDVKSVLNNNTLSS